MLFDWGYEGKKKSDFIRVLKKLAVSIVVDVRYRAWSHKPDFCKASLRKICKELGVMYYHAKDLGNPYFKNPNWEQLYRAELNGNTKSMKLIKTWLHKGFNILLLCKEANREQCHRKIIIEKLKVLPVEVLG